MKRLRMTVLATTLAALLAHGGTAQVAPGGQRFQVRAVELDGEWRCSVFADSARATEVLDALAAQCRVAIEGIDAIPASTRIDVDLRDRPVRQVLEYVLGSIGLRAESRVGTWTLHASLRAPLSPEELRDAAMGAYLSGLRDFPEHEAGAAALIAQSEIEDQRGHAAAARVVLDTLVERYPDSELVPEALMRAGELFEHDSDWASAADRFSSLLRLEMPHGLEARARIGLAMCSVQLGESGRALLMLDALDSLNPAVDEADWTARELVRARAWIATDDAGKALDLLDRIDQGRLSAEQSLESKELRAGALEALGRPSDAARTWLAYHKEAQGNERTIALRHAARLALEAGDELSVLMIHSLSKDLGAAETTATLADQARERLSLGTDAVDGPRAVDRLDRALELLTAGMTNEAASAFAALGPLRMQLDEEHLTRYALEYGRLLARITDVDTALEFLRESVPGLRDAENRRAVYLMAGELLEDAGRTDDAIEAYQGKL